MLNLNDIIALAKQGYKPSDVKELIELSKTVEASEPDQEQPTETPEEVKEAPKEAPKEEEKKEGAQAAEIVDYKAKVEELEKKLSDLQKANTKQNADKSEDKKSDAELFADVVKSFM